MVELGGIKAGILVCEDIWEPEPAARRARAGRRAAAGHQCLALRGGQAAAAGAARWRGRASPRPALPLVFVNLIGGQDELVFDGNSFVMDARGEVTMRAPAFTEGMYAVDLAARRGRRGRRRCPGAVAPLQGQEESVYGALVQGTRDYVDKHRFPGVVLGPLGRRRFGADAVHRGRRARAPSGCIRWRCLRATPRR